MLALLAGCSTTKRDLPAPTGKIPPAATALPVPVSPVLPTAAILRPSTYSALPGWAQDDLREAWPAFRASCEVLIRKPEWKDVCTLARDVALADARIVRQFFESMLVPHQVVNADGTDQGLVTGYYEPLLRGARKRSGVFQTPLYRRPDDLLNVDLAGVYPELKSLRLRGRMVANKVVPYWTRAELMQGDTLAGRELLWVDDPIDAFFLQVQGSGRVQLTDSQETVRVSYADQNGHPYKSIGRYLVDRGEMTLEQASA